MKEKVVIGRDEKGRTTVFMNGGDIIFCRYADMTEKMKKALEGVFRDTSAPNASVDEFRKFLDFKEDTDEFCS